MKLTNIAVLLLALFWSVSLGCVSSLAQSELRALYKDEFLPVEKVASTTMLVRHEGKLKRSDFNRCSLFSAEEFGVGLIEIVNEKTENEQSHKKGKHTDFSGNEFFNYEATIKADRELKDCFAVLTFAVGASPRIWVKDLGKLSNGEEKKVKMKVGSTKTKLGRLHVFSQGKEIQSNKVREPYNIVYDEYAAFQRGGVPASILWGYEEHYPHRLSPSGRYLATFRDDGSTNRIIIYDLNEGNVENEIEIGEHNESVHSLNWINEDQFIFIVDEKLRRVGRRSSGVEDLVGGVRLIVSMLWDDPNRVLLASSVKSNMFFLYDLNTQNRENKSTIGDFNYAWFDYNGVPRIKMIVDSDRIKFYHRDKPQGRWRLLDDLVTQEGIVFNYSGASALEQRVFIDSFSKDPDKLYVYYNDDGTTNKFAEFSLSEGKITRIFAGSKTYDLGGGVYMPESEVLYRKFTNEAIGIRYMTSKPRVSWFHPDFATAQDMFNQLNPDTLNVPIDWTDDALTFVFRCESEKHPGKYYVYKPLEQRQILLFDSLPGIDGYELGDIKPVSFEARDGYAVRGYLTTPPGYDEKAPLPTVVIPHGGPWVRDTWGYRSQVQFFATRGYAVLQVNYRGSIGYGRKHVQSGIGNIDTVMIDDVADGTQHFIDNKIIDPDNVFIYGGSFGGYLVYMGMIKYPELYKAGVAFAAVSHYGKQIRNRKGTGKFAYQFWKYALGAPNNKELMERVSPYFYPDKIKGPIRLYHGTRDWVVPVEQTEMMVKALSKTDVDYDVTYFSGEGHGLYRLENTMKMYSEIETFFQENLSSTAVKTEMPTPLNAERQ